MKALFDSLRTSSPYMNHVIVGLLFGLVAIEAGCEGLLKQAQEVLRLPGLAFSREAQAGLTS